MTWFAAKPASAEWGWHWTMNHFNPDARTNGRRAIAAHDYPLLGPYDSGDPDVLECHVLLMKFAGIGGVFVDWYGTDDFLDYGLVQRNTLRLVPFLKKAGLKFAIVYEDSTVPRLISANQLPQTQVVAHGQRLMQWMQAHWFTAPCYLSMDGHPVLLSFGSGYYSGAQWGQIFSVLPQTPAFFTESERRIPAVGGFDWPQPGKGTLGALHETALFDARASQWPLFIPAAFPRFCDMYAEAGVQKSWGRIADQNGKTYRQTLTAARAGGASVVQLVTWNDWGEGTQIEPSAEVGYRDLEATQSVHPALPYTAQDLRLPVRLYVLRKKFASNPTIQAKLNQVSALLFADRLPEARRRMVLLEKRRQALSHATGYNGGASVVS